MYFSRETETSALKLFINTSAASEKIDASPKEACEVVGEASQYFTNRKWKLLSSDQVQDAFIIQSRQKVKNMNTLSVSQENINYFVYCRHMELRSV